MIPFRQQKELDSFLSLELEDYKLAIKNKNKYCSDNETDDCFLYKTYKIFQTSIESNIPTYMLVVFEEIGEFYYTHLLNKLHEFMKENRVLYYWNTYSSYDNYTAS